MTDPKPFGYYQQGFRGVFGEKKIEVSSANKPLTAIYLEPTYEGQKPFACTGGLFLYDLKHVATHNLRPVYKGVL